MRIVPHHPSFETNVFLNCPFDDDYQPIFQALVFAVYDCGFLPHCALEESDSGDVRFDKIVRLLKTCRYSIHDVSRASLDPNTNLPRFNMPLELGVELGLRYSGGAKWKAKQCLVLDTERYRYRDFISDIAGQDIRAHANDPKKAVEQVRNWLRTASKQPDVPGGSKIFEHYEAFWADLPEAALRVNLQVTEMTYLDYVKFIERWLKEKLPPGSPSR